MFVSSAMIIGGVSLMVLITAFGNLMVFYTIYKDPRLHRVENAFHISLAVADLLMAFLIMTVDAVTEVNGRWIFNKQFCNIWLAVDFMCSTASIFNLCAISMDRYLYINNPFRYSRVVTRRSAFGSIAGLWTLAALMTALPISLQLHRKTPEKKPYTCVVDQEEFVVVTFSISFLLPCLVMVCMYSRLYQISRQSVKNLATLCPGQRPLRRDHKAALTIGVIMGFFLVCWTPYFVVFLFSTFSEGVPETLLKALTWLGYANSMFDPYIYTSFNTELRNSLIRTVRKEFAKRNSPQYNCPSRTNNTTNVSVV